MAKCLTLLLGADTLTDWGEKGTAIVMSQFWRENCLIAACLAATSLSARAEPIVIGPIPYRSVADSPLDMSGLGETFFLEDFEDGEILDSPGIVTSSVFIRGGIAADSVDADDGVLDGWGSDGLSATGVLVISGSSSFYAANIVFDENELGWLPTAVGFVWTDLEFLPSNPAGFVFGVENALGERVVEYDASEFVLVEPQGSAENDRFFAIIDPDGISKVRTVRSIIVYFP